MTRGNIPTPAGKITVLFLIADPDDVEALDLYGEYREIQLELGRATFKDRFDLRLAPPVRSDELQSLLLYHEPHIVHFSGHGSRTGALLLKDQTGSSHQVKPAALAELFASCKDSVRCVVLNACYSAKLADRLAQSIEAQEAPLRALVRECAAAASGLDHGARGAV